MSYEITIKEACKDGFWGCLTPTDWIQLVSVLIAMAAAVAAYLTVSLTRKQFKEESEERRKRYKPFFKVKSLDKSTKENYYIGLINEGFPYFVLTETRWEGDEGVSIESSSSYQVTNRGKDNTITEKYESLMINLKIHDDLELEGKIIIKVLDLEHNSFTFRTPLIKIKNKNIKDSVNLTYQYLK